MTVQEFIDKTCKEIEEAYLFTGLKPVRHCYGSGNQGCIARALNVRNGKEYGYECLEELIDTMYSQDFGGSLLNGFDGFPYLIYDIDFKKDIKRVTTCKEIRKIGNYIGVEMAERLFNKAPVEEIHVVV